MLWKRSVWFISACLVVGISVLMSSSGANSSSETEGVRRDLVINEKDVPYNISGSTAQELLAAMIAQGIVDDDGKPAFARTDSKFNYAYQRVPIGFECSMLIKSVTVTTRVLLPRWKDPPVQASNRLKAEWNTFVEALTVHERGHQQISRTAGQKLLRGLLLIQLADCIMWEPLAKKVFDRIKKEHKEEQVRYNHETANGGKQGAIWPPESTGRR